MSMNEIVAFSVMVNLKITLEIFLEIIFYLWMASPEVCLSVCLSQE